MLIGMGTEAVILDWNISFNVTIYLTLATRRKRINVVVRVLWWNATSTLMVLKVF